MALRVAAILIVAIIIRKHVLHEASAAVYRSDYMPSYNPSFSKDFSNLRRQQVSGKVEINNGKPIKIEDYPFLVGIIGAWSDVLGQGSIIGTRWVLTAAHCFINNRKNVTDSQVKAGLLQIYSNTSNLTSGSTVKRKIIAFYNHERYNTMTLDWDISIVKADRQFDGIYEKTTPFADPSYYYKSFSHAEVLGLRDWMLAKAKVYITPQKSCKQVYHKNHTITSRKVCAHGWAEGGCDCDNGGPLYQHRRIIGILSSYTGKKYDVSMNIFTRISHFNSFILRITSGTVAYTIDETPNYFNNLRRQQEATNPVGIINGNFVKIEDYPFMVGILKDDGVKVTHGKGSIIGTRWV